MQARAKGKNLFESPFQTLEVDDDFGPTVLVSLGSFDSFMQPIAPDFIEFWQQVWCDAQGHRILQAAVLESFVVIPLGSAEAELSARWRREFRARGVTLKIADTAIAATAALRGVPLMTGNTKDFPMPELWARA